MVLGYHHVRDDVAQAVRAADLHAQMEWLCRQDHLTVQSLPAAHDALVDGLTHRSVVLTFDDGYDDFHDVALPVLADRGLPATLFVPVALLGTPGYMTAAQLRECAGAGVDVGGHSRHHVDLRSCDAAGLQREVRGCREDLEDLLGTEVASFAYPAGFYDARVRTAVRDAGYRVAVTTHRGWWRQGGDPLQVPRSFVEDVSLPTFGAAARGGFHVLGLADTLRGVDKLGRATSATAPERTRR